MTLAFSLVGGALTGIILNVEGLFHPLKEEEFFNDDLFWNVPDDPEDQKSVKKDFADFSLTP